MKTSEIVDRCHELEAQIKPAQEELKTLKGQLIDGGAGVYHGTDGRKATVISVSEKLEPNPNEEAVLAAKKIAGETFEKLFEKVVTYRPLKSFRELALALLTPAKARKVITACEKPGYTFVKLSA